MDWVHPRKLQSKVNTMQKIALAVDLKDDPDLIKEYCDHHANVWPEVASSLKQVGVVEMNIYRVGLRLFMVIEAADDFDMESGLPGYLKLHPRCQEWEDMMDKFHERLPYAQPGEKWARMENVCHLE